MFRMVCGAIHVQSFQDYKQCIIYTTRLMQTHTLKLPDNFVNLLTNLPESGMGYQIVKVILRSGKVLHQHKIINSSLLMLEENENITEKDIEKIELENKK